MLAGCTMVSAHALTVHARTCMSSEHAHTHAHRHRHAHANTRARTPRPNAHKRRRMRALKVLKPSEIAPINAFLLTEVALHYIDRLCRRSACAAADSREVPLRFFGGSAGHLPHDAPLRLQCRLSCSVGMAFTCRRCVDRASNYRTGRAALRRPSMQRDCRVEFSTWSAAQVRHICTAGTELGGAALAPATSAPGLGSPLPRLRRDWGSPVPHLRRDWGSAWLPVPSGMRRRSFVRGGARGTLPLRCLPKLLLLHSSRNDHSLCG